MSAVLERTAFELDRTLEFFTESELRQQISYGRDTWRVAILRELIDNALDAAESDVDVTVDARGFTVMDHGPGLPAETIVGALNYTIRKSDKAAYISPTRGAMGNALKVVFAAPFVDTGEGRFTIYARGTVHSITVDVDQIRQQPRIRHQKRNAGYKKGTVFRIHWPDSARQLLPDEGEHFLQSTARQLLVDYSMCNPHVRFTLNGEVVSDGTGAFKKWLISDPTPPHWYDHDTLRNLVANYIATAPDKTVREFVAEFKGLSSTAKQKAVGFTGDRLADHADDNGIDADFINELLSRMQAQSKPPKPAALGIIGKDSLTAWARARGASADTIKYKKADGNDGMPYIVEAVFGINEDQSESRHMTVGLNWSPTIGARPSNDISERLAQSMVEPHDPVVVGIHVARPRFDFADRGKTRVEMVEFGMAADVQDTIRLVCADWEKAKRRDAKSERISQRELDRMRRSDRKKTIRQAAFEIMEDAFMHSSSGGQYLANARQIMYAARGYILEETGKRELSDVYFTQQLLKDYLMKYRPSWSRKVVWDARGTLLEPHTDITVDLGGADVGKYCGRWRTSIDKGVPSVSSSVSTHGPENRYQAALFIEKEGFTEILRQSGIQERYDLAIMSTKGVPVDACCELINKMESKGVTVFALHDFDPAGFKIAKTLRNGTRMTGPNDNVVEIGLRLEDVEAMALEDEPFQHSQEKNPGEYLLECGATPDEIDMLVQRRGNGYIGRRVEINAMTSEQLIEFIERKLEDHGVQKVVPDENIMHEAFKRAAFAKAIQEKIEELEDEIDEAEVPDDLADSVEDYLEDNPKSTWDYAVWHIAHAEEDDE